LAGWLAGWLCSLPAPADLLINKRLEKVLDLLATAENISVIKVLLLLNPKHSSYSEEN